MNQLVCFILYPVMVSNSVCSQGWPWTSNPLAFTSRVVGLHMYMQLHVLYAVQGMEPRALRMARQALYQLSYILSPNESVLKSKTSYLSKVCIS